MNPFDNWLKQATRSLAKESAAQVRAEIQDHYESAREAAILRGADPAEADRIALDALGDASAANRQYSRVLLTASEARVLREGNWEARALCSRRWVKGLLLAIALIAWAGSAVLFITGWHTLGRVVLALGTGTGFVFLMPFLPVYTLSRGRVFRVVRWIVQVLLLLLALGPGGLSMSGIFTVCLWVLMKNEWTRYSIRRKLPVAQWPRQLYI